MEHMDREFFKKYHRAVVKAHRDDLERFKSRIGSDWAAEFRDMSGGELKGEDFDRALEGYLNEELRFCEKAEVKREDDLLKIGVKGCHICFGNEELRKQGGSSLCPIIPTGLFSISRVARRKATLQAVNKNGVVGECDICYSLD